MNDFYLCGNIHSTLPSTTHDYYDDDVWSFQIHFLILKSVLYTSVYGGASIVVNFWNEHDRLTYMVSIFQKSIHSLCSVFGVYMYSFADLNFRWLWYSYVCLIVFKVVTLCLCTMSVAVGQISGTLKLSFSYFLIVVCLYIVPFLLFVKVSRAFRSE